MEGIKIVQAYYDSDPQTEWNRLDGDQPEFVISSRFIARYVQPGSRVLDIGGGPGRYSMWLAQRGCDVTLADLSGGNVNFAREKAAELGLSIATVQANALDLSAFADASFDHVLLMGPLYHLTEEADRRRAISEALRVLKAGGTLSCAFISSFAGIIYALKELPDCLLYPEIAWQFDDVVADKPFSGMAFTHAYFIRQQDVLPLMESFPLDTLHLLGAEGILAPNEHLIMAQPQHLRDAWMDYAQRLCERPDLLKYSEHFLHIGRKRRGD